MPILMYVLFKFHGPFGISRQITFFYTPPWADLAANVASIYDIPRETLALTYEDDGGDPVFMTSNEHLQDFYRYSLHSKDHSQPDVYTFTVYDLGIFHPKFHTVPHSMAGSSTESILSERRLESLRSGLRRSNAIRHSHDGYGTSRQARLLTPTTHSSPMRDHSGLCKVAANSTLEIHIRPPQESPKVNATSGRHHEDFHNDVDRGEGRSSVSHSDPLSARSSPPSDMPLLSGPSTSSKRVSTSSASIYDMYLSVSSHFSHEDTTQEDAAVEIAREHVGHEITHKASMPGAFAIEEAEDVFVEAPNHSLEETFVCGICFDSVPIPRVILVGNCEHTFCSDCMEGYVRSKLQERRFPLMCPACMADETGDSDPNELPEVVITKLSLSEKEVAVYYELQLANIAILVHCPKCAEEMFIDKAQYQEDIVIRCPLPACGYRWCRKCHETVTGASSSHECSGDGSSELRSLMTAQGWKICPGCQTPTSKTVGCNHMTCVTPGCNAHFCYRCGDMITQSVVPEEIRNAKFAHYKDCDMYAAVTPQPSPLVDTPRVHLIRHPPGYRPPPLHARLIMPLRRFLRNL